MFYRNTAVVFICMFIIIKTVLFITFDYFFLKFCLCLHSSRTSKAGKVYCLHSTHFVFEGLLSLEQKINETFARNHYSCWEYWFNFSGNTANHLIFLFQLMRGELICLHFWSHFSVLPEENLHWFYRAVQQRTSYSLRTKWNQLSSSISVNINRYTGYKNTWFNGIWQKIDEIRCVFINRTFNGITSWLSIIIMLLNRLSFNTASVLGSHVVRLLIFVFRTMFFSIQDIHTQKRNIIFTLYFQNNDH